MAGAIPRRQALRPSRSERPPIGFARAPPASCVPVSPGRVIESRDANGVMTRLRMGQKSAFTSSCASRNRKGNPSFLIPSRHGPNRAFDALLPAGLEALPSNLKIHTYQSEPKRDNCIGDLFALLVAIIIMAGS